MTNVLEKISIIIPAYNEAGYIAKNIGIIVKTFQGFGCSFELIVVDDGSTDGTFEAAVNAAKFYPGQVIVKKNAYNIGKGRAFKRAIHFVTGDYTVFMDADMDLHPQQVPTLFSIMRLDNADVVIGSKMHPNSVVSYSWERRVVSWCYYFVVKVLFGLPCHDTQTGLKLFKTKVLKKVFPRILVKKFAFDLEVLVNAFHLGYKIVEAPIVLTPQRRFGRIGFRAIFSTAWDTCAVWYRMYILKYYDNIDYHRRKNLAKEFRKLRR
jgi:glycosyltransferase involved in cell wall biosynthesis